jgi:serine/threonine protein kinase
LSNSLVPNEGEDVREYRGRLMAPLMPIIPDLSGQEIGGGYVAVRRLGSGGFGTVYEIRQRKAGAGGLSYAAKFFPAGHRGMSSMRAEFEVLQDTDVQQHWNIIRFRMPIEEAQQRGVFLVTDLVDGGSLDRWGRGGDVAAPKDVVSWMLQLLDALMFLHPRPDEIAAAHEAHAEGRRWMPPEGTRHPLVHWDIKPANIMLTGDRAILVDFNVAMSLSRSGSVIGLTQLYADPAIDSNDPEPFDVAIDLYAAGVTAYELIAGCYPYEHMSRLPHRQVEPLTPCPRPNVPISLFDWAVKACRPNREDRFQSAEEMHDALVQVAKRMRIPHDPCRGPRLVESTS